MNRRLRVLFVCAQNKKRSLTAELLYRNDPRVEARSAGVRTDARRRVGEKDLAWADVVFAMEREHKRRILELFPDADLPPIEVLGVPDDYEFNDPALVEMLRAMLDPEIDDRLAGLVDDTSDGVFDR